MKLYFSPASPYVRKVMVVAHEKGLADRIEPIISKVSPIERNEEIARYNPLGKVPCLVLDDGRALADSRVIVAYLDSLAAPALNPTEGAARYDALALEALADGLLDGCLLVRYETLLRPKELLWPEWVSGQYAKIDGALDLLETRWIDALNGPVTIGVIAAACALGYLDFRFESRDWRTARPRLAAFFATFSKRPSLQATWPRG
jgi:glutathione S-transferase